MTKHRTATCEEWRRERLELFKAEKELTHLNDDLARRRQELPWDEGCTSCSGVADGFNQTHLHLQNHDVAFSAVSRAPVEKLLAYRERMEWTFPWVSSGRSEFNYDFHVMIDASVAPVEYNYQDQAELEQANIDWREWSGEQPGMSAFAIDDSVVYHTYSAYARGFDALWTMWQWLDRVPLGRNEDDLPWFRRHDEYDARCR